MNETTIYTVRPGGTSLWLPSGMAEAMGIKWGTHLTVEQFEGEQIQALIRARMIAEKSRRKT